MPLNFQQSISKKPLVSYFTRERASLNLPFESSSSGVAQLDSMPKRKRTNKRRTRKTGKKRRIKTSNKIRVIGGRVKLKVRGYQGLQSLAPSSLVRFIPSTKLRLAARKVLRSIGHLPNTRRRKSGKRRKGRGKSRSRKG